MASNDKSTIMQLVKPGILGDFVIQDVNTVGKRECEKVFVLPVWREGKLNASNQTERDSLGLLLVLPF